MGQTNLPCEYQQYFFLDNKLLSSIHVGSFYSLYCNITELQALQGLCYYLGEREGRVWSGWSEKRGCDLGGVRREGVTWVE